MLESERKNVNLEFIKVLLERQREGFSIHCPVCKGSGDACSGEYTGSVYEVCRYCSGCGELERDGVEISLQIGNDSECNKSALLKIMKALMQQRGSDMKQDDYYGPFQNGNMERDTRYSPFQSGCMGDGSKEESVGADYVPGDTELVGFNHGAEPMQKADMKQIPLVQVSSKAYCLTSKSIDMGFSTMKSPFSDHSLESIQAGGELDRWVARVLEYPEKDVPPFSTDWRGTGMLLEKMSETEDFVALTFIRQKSRWDFEKGIDEPLPPEEWDSRWIAGWGGALEGHISGQDIDPKVSVCKGIIWLKTHEEHRKELLNRAYELAKQVGAKVSLTIRESPFPQAAGMLNIKGEMDQEKLEQFQKLWSQESKK